MIHLIEYIWIMKLFWTYNFSLYSYYNKWNLNNGLYIHIGSRNVYQKLRITVKIQDKVLGFVCRNKSIFFKTKVTPMYIGLFVQPRFEWNYITAFSSSFHYFRQIPTSYRSSEMVSNISGVLFTSIFPENRDKFSRNSRKLSSWMRMPLVVRRLHGCLRGPRAVLQWKLSYSS